MVNRKESYYQTLKDLRDERRTSMPEPEYRAGFFTPQLTMGQGLQIFLACLPVALNGLVSGILQGKVSAAGVAVAAKQPNESMKAVILSALVETYAVLGLLITILLLIGIKI